MSPIDPATLAYCGPGDEPVQCAALVDFAIALRFGSWSSQYANTWLQGGSYCSWPGVGCAQGTYSCCYAYPGQFVGNAYGAASAVLGVNCTINGACGYGPAYGGQAPLGGNNSVVSLSFAYVGLSGTLPATLGNLRWLEALSFQYESLSGTLPASMAQLTRLQLFTLSGGLMNGTMDVLASLPALTSVSIAGNGMYVTFSGSFPNFISSVLTSLSFSSMVQLQVPAWNLPSLTSLSLTSLMSGGSSVAASYSYVTVPAVAMPSGWNLPALQQLTIQGAPNLYGALPPASAFPALLTLSVQNCGLNGTLPALPRNLTSITFTGTPFTGTLDAMASSGFTQLVALSISGASLSGSIPPALVPALNTLGSCSLAGSGLQCPLPAGLTKLACNPNSCPLSSGAASGYCGAGDDPVQCAALVDFAIALRFGSWSSQYANTWLQGGSYCSWPGVGCAQGTYSCCYAYPGQFVGNAYGAASAVLGVNCTINGACGYGPAYGGQAPLGGNNSVVSLSFAYVGLSGTLPATLGNLRWLEALSFQYESLSGTLPASMAQLTRLQLFTLSGGLMNGTMDVLASLPALTSVSIAGNGMYVTFSGSFPNFISSVLTSLSFSSMVQLQVPAWNLPSLTSLSLTSLMSGGSSVAASYSYVTVPAVAMPSGWNLPALQQLTIQGAPNLYGALPPASAFPALLTLSVQNCGLNGTLPALPRNLTSITFTGTPFTGTLDAMASSGFTQLVALSISGASLSGSIPPALVPALNTLGSCSLAGSGLQCPLPAGLTKLACNPNGC